MVNRVAISEICTYSKTRISASNVNQDNYVGVDNLLQNRAGKTISRYVPKIGNCTCYEHGDILIGNINPHLKKIWHADCLGGASGDVLVIRLQDKDKEQLNTRYLYHVLASDDFFAYNTQNAKGAKMPHGDKAAIMNYIIPVPSLEEQSRIVSILDKFDALVNDISCGLPAEIAARRKQYHYYRDKLLAFEEAGW